MENRNGSRRTKGLSVSRWFKNTFARPAGSVALLGGLMLNAAPVMASSVNAGDMTINGSALSSLLDSSGKVPVSAGLTQAFRYTGVGQNCTDTEWYIKLQGATQWENFDHTKYAEKVIHRAGTHQLKLTVDGYNNPLLLCFREGQYSEKVVQLKINTPSYTQTKYPIMVVPGVLAYDSINLLVTRIDYIYDLANKIGAQSDHRVHTFSLNPWQDTVPRGEDLARQILDQIVISQARDHVPFTKVNLLAHSHGATTSRVALRWLQEQGLDKVASLTTVAGPHYGTPTADGAKHGLETWGLVGTTLEHTLIPFFEGVGCILATLAGDSHFCNEMDKADPMEGGLMAVLDDFTQRDMYTFNKTAYPSYGVPTGGKYFLDSLGSSPERATNFYDAYGRGAYESWFAGAHRVYGVTQPDGSVVNHQMVVGDGLGQRKGINEPGAVQFYSFSGNAPANSMPRPAPFSDDTLFKDVMCIGSEMPTDILMDSVLCVFSSFYGAMYWNKMKVPYESDFPAGSPQWIPNDGFIPVDSARFGRYLDTFYWNHVDEQNQFLGIIPAQDKAGVAVASPLDVYSMHANRLQKSGL